MGWGMNVYEQCELGKDSRLGVCRSAVLTALGASAMMWAGVVDGGRGE